MLYTDSVKTMDNYKSQFTLEMAKASLFHTIGKTSTALHILEIINTCEHDSTQKAILTSQITALTSVIQSQAQPLWMLLSDSLVQAVDSTLFAFDYESIIDSSGFGSYIEGPNSVYFSACDLSQGPFYSSLFQGNGALNAQSNFTVYPNPVQGDIYIISKNTSFAEDSPEKVFRLLDVLGKEIYREALSAPQQELSVPKFAAGTYIYTISTDTELLDQGRLLFMR